MWNLHYNHCLVKLLDMQCSINTNELEPNPHRLICKVYKETHMPLTVRMCHIN